MTNTYAHLANVVDTLKAEGKTVTVTKLPAASKAYRRSAWSK